MKDDHPIDTRKNELNDLSAITKQNLCDDKSFSQDLNNSFNIETNESNEEQEEIEGEEGKKGEKLEAPEADKRMNFMK